MNEPNEPSIWQIDGGDLIETVGGGWDAFAKENDASDLAGKSVVGRSLFDFIAGDEVRRVHQHLLRSVRRFRTPLAVPFRCDSPDLRRHMRLEMRPAGGGAVEFRAVLLRAERQPHLRLLDAAEPRSYAFVVSCSFCHKIREKDEGGEWMEVDTAADRLGLLVLQRPPRLVHGVCPSCKATLGRLRDRDVDEDPDTPA